MLKLKSMARASLERLANFRPSNANARLVYQLEKRTKIEAVHPSPQHLHNAIQWIKRAQDSNGTGGVAWGYRTRRPIRSELRLGWVEPYPETTGYIIPTMLRYANLTGDEDSALRARRMTEWEMSIQLPDGGIQGGVYGSKPVVSSTFNTGQALFGLVAAYRHFHDDRMLQAAVRAGEFLLGCLDETGRFTKGFSLFCAAGVKAYEARTGFGLIELAEITGDERFRTAASGIANYALSMQLPNGWFRENDLDSNEQPLTHTIGYVLEGLHGIGKVLQSPECYEAVQRTLDHMLPLVPPNGFLKGRWLQDWTPAVEWSCLTGVAQIGGVYLRMFAETGKRAYFDAGERLLGFVCFSQEPHTGVEELDGGIRGSYPFDGNYGQWSVLNWATKFFCDTCMDYQSLQAERAAA